ncbi:uncharacterized protein [Nicotiana sylvestris]|uniref:uncharacterized protein n=1 Tax=Nicotiana sylvestris TaxID=4096 RepID=UPI00388CA613
MSSKETDTRVVDPPRQIVESESELQEEVQRLKYHMAEMYQAWIKGHPSPSFPTNYTENLASIPPLSQSQMPNIIDLSPQHAPGFTPYHNYPGTSTQTIHALPAKTTSYPTPICAPIFVPPPHATLHRSSSEPAFPATDAHYYAPEPTFKVPDSYSYTPQFEPHVKTDKPPKNAEQEEMFRKVQSLQQSLRNMQGLGNQVSVAYKDLCLFPNVVLPVGFKMPKFDLYDGHGDSVAHLRGYFSKMRGTGGKDELLMAYFSQSVSGATLEWYTRQDASRWYTWDDMAQAFSRHFQYNIDIVPDCLSLTKVEKKPSEIFREYGFQWREQGARVNHPMEEDEMVKYFLQALKPTYYGHLISAIGKSFNDVVKMGEILEEGLKSSKIMSYSAIKATTQAIQSGTRSLLGKKKKEDVAMVVSGSWHGQIVQIPNAPNINQNPLPAHAETHKIGIVHKDGEPKKSSKSIMMIRASESNLVKSPDSTKATPLTVEGVTEKPSSLNSKPLVLVVKGLPKDIGESPESSKVVVPGIPSKPIIVVKGDPITPIIIKPVTQLPVVDAKAVPWNYKQVIVTYKGKEIEEEVNETGGLTRSGRCFTSEELRKAKPFKDSQMPVKKLVTEEEAKEFLKKMKVHDYSIVEKLRKTSAPISLLSLLIHSDEHRRVLMKILNEAHVPDKITVNHLEKIAGKIFEANKSTFSDDELTMEDSVVSRVLVDKGSSENICPLCTLQKLKIGTERIHLNSVLVRGFDGGGKDSVGDIMLELSIWPVEFTMEFQVLDVAVSYNLLLGRPWIHAAKVVPSFLHQMVKFEWDRQEIVMHGDEDLSACNDTIFPFIEAEDDKGLWVYQTFETVSVEKIPEGICIPGPKLSSASVMVVNEMLKNGFLPGMGLGSSMQGIVHPVRPSGNPGTFGLGFMPIEKDVKKG